MDIAQFRIALTPFVQFFAAVFVSGAGVAYVTQFLKDKQIPIPAEKYPRTTAAVLSVVATFVSIYLVDINLVLTTAWQYAVMVIGILFVSASFYHKIVAGVGESKEPSQRVL